MKTAIFHYDYKTYGGYKPSSVNLGDYIQSLAASFYFKNVNKTIDRDSLSNVLDEVAVIGNGWYFINKDKHKLQDNCNFLPVSVHINNRLDADISTIKSFANKNSPIGCRDLATLDFLQKNKINSYFSSCLTTTITQDKLFSSPVHEIKRGGDLFSGFGFC